MNMKDGINFILILILALYNPVTAFTKAEVEGNMVLIENLSKISQIKGIENEIKGKARKTNTNKAGICSTKIERPNDMKINSDMLIKGEVFTSNIHSKLMNAQDHA